MTLTIPLFMLLGQTVVKSAVLAAPSLDGLLRLHTPPDIHDVLRLVADSLDTHWILE